MIALLWCYIVFIVIFSLNRSEAENLTPSVSRGRRALLQSSAQTGGPVSPQSLLAGEIRSFSYDPVTKEKISSPSNFYIRDILAAADSTPVGIQQDHQYGLGAWMSTPISNHAVDWMYGRYFTYLPGS